MMDLMATWWTVAMFLTGAIEQQHLARNVLSAQDVVIGARLSEVYKTLGPPVATYDAYSGWSIFALGKHPKQLCYGTHIDLDALVVIPDVGLQLLPFHLRILGYASDDLVVDLTPDDRVEGIRFPERQYHVDERFEGVLKMVYFVRAIAIATTSLAEQH